MPRPCRSAPGCYDGIMRLALDPLRFLLISLAGWLNQLQQDIIDYLHEENRVLRSSATNISVSAIMCSTLVRLQDRH